jgi:hypothetical protein
MAEQEKKEPQPEKVISSRRRPVKKKGCGCGKKSSKSM